MLAKVTCVCGDESSGSTMGVDAASVYSVWPQRNIYIVLVAKLGGKIGLEVLM